MNPLDSEEMFYLTLANPNPTSGKNKQGSWYRVSFELTPDEHQMFMDAETKGMVIECACIVVYRNEEQRKECDPNTVDAFTGKTDNELKGGPLSVRSDALARDEEFHEYLKVRQPGYVVYEKEGVKVTDPVEISRVFIRDACNVQSRKELDHNEVAGKKFLSIVSDFTKWRAQTLDVV